MNEETKEYYERVKESLSLEVKLLSTFQFYRSIKDTNYQKLSGNLIVTRNNYDNNDVDFYYEECERIIKNEKWENINSDELKNNEIQGTFEESDKNENLIDEIFDLILEDKK